VREEKKNADAGNGQEAYHKRRKQSQRKINNTNTPVEREREASITVGKYGTEEQRRQLLSYKNHR